MTMSTNRIDGAVNKASGSIKEAVGKATHNTDLEAKGAAQKIGGTVENKVGKAQDAVGSALKR